ncbi:unknown seed protein like 1 [Striga hermonthica]|uniref:BURP domain-containing protein n=1 Tax=Striga hermonthica TaxID=68872 RepID=A0A9N7MHL3_STRHE|nr:unknown seed protein like 1 [Striga hermonthica]
MDVKLAVCSILLLTLQVLSRNTNGSSNEISNKPMMRIEQVVDSHSSSHHHHHHMDPSTIVFFFLEDLTQGNTMPIYFPNRELSEATHHLLSKTEADSIPFSSEKFHYLLEYFSLPENSPQAVAIEDTLRECETSPIEGETKLCVTSFESMLDFAKSMIGSGVEIRILSTNHVKRSDKSVLLQKYTIREIQAINAPKMVACHTMPYPYAVFYCHYQETENRIYRVSLQGENGDEVNAVAVCHMDTSHWSRNHVSFKVLGAEPGSSPICHFFPADNFVLVPSISLKE